MQRECEEIIHKLVSDIELGTEPDENMRCSEEYWGVLSGTSGNIRNVLNDKAEIEAYGKIELVPKGEGVVEYGVVRRCFSDMSGSGRASADSDGTRSAQQRD